MRSKATLDYRISTWGTLSLRELLLNGRTIQEIFARAIGRTTPLMATAISPLGWLDSAGALGSLERFLPDGPADFPNGHRAVLVCRECGDFGCGALTVRVSLQHNMITWDEWLWQTEYDDSAREDFEQEVPAFEFDPKQYLATLHRALSES